MMIKKVRYLSQAISEDLLNRMVFIGGPRQVGKTTLALTFLKNTKIPNPAYLNWDHMESRSKILRGEIPPNEKIVIFDEIHKNRKWRTTIKGLYDLNKDAVQFIVTGSARLDHYRRGGDSLFGRYHYFRLHPFTLMELSDSPTKSDYEDLVTLSGFPEPLFSGKQKNYKRWHLERIKRVVYTDINDLENLKDVSQIQLLIESLSARIGSPLSIENLRQDLQVSHPTTCRWLDILDSVYMTYRISPFGSPKIRAVKKEQKLYFWDWVQAQAEGGARFENLVASHLLKFCNFQEDAEGEKMELRFLRDKDGREIDFVVLKNGKPIFAVECKTGERELSKHIGYFKNRTQIPKFYQVHLGQKDFGHAETGGRCLPFWTFCKELNLV
jgi:predicted AAA+ superfamily ATPase